MAVPARWERSTGSGGVKRLPAQMVCKWFRGGEKKKVGEL
jgi:hypothetical protein